MTSSGVSVFVFVWCYHPPHPGSCLEVKRNCMVMLFGIVMCVVMCCLLDHNAVTNHSRERALLKGAWVCVASENKALCRHQQTGVMWNLRHPAALYCIFHRLTSPLTPYSPFSSRQLLPKTPVVFISLVLSVALPLCLSLSAVLLWKTIIDQLPPLSNWFPLFLFLFPFFSVLPLWAVHCIHFCLQSFTIFPTFFLLFFPAIFSLEISYITALLYPHPLSSKYLCTLWTRCTQGQNSNTRTHTACPTELSWISELKTHNLTLTAFDFDLRSHPLLFYLFANFA